MASGVLVFTAFLIAATSIPSVNDPRFDKRRNSAVEPEVNFERDSYDWLHRFADVLDAQKTMDPQVVMIGDSITHFWGGEPKSNTTHGPKAWAATFGTTRVLNMGCGWDRTQNVLWRLEHGQFIGIRPSSVVVNIGTNNLVGDSTARTNTPAETEQGIEAILQVLRKRAPKAKIFVMAVFPRGFEKGNDLDRRISLLNAILKRRLSGRHQITVLDIGDRLREPDGSISPRIFLDGTHPSEAGYEIWGRALREAGAVPPSS